MCPRAVTFLFGTQSRNTLKPLNESWVDDESESKGSLLGPQSLPIQLSQLIFRPNAEYETSSEGAVRNAQEKQAERSKNLPKVGSEYGEAENSSSKEDRSLEESTGSQKTVCLSNVLTKSESMPVLRSTSSKEENSEVGNVAIGSESSLARQRKMKIIVARMGPLLSSESNLTVNTSTDASKANLRDENYEAKKLESKIELPVLQDMKPNQSSCSKEVTFWEVSDDGQSAGRSRSPNRERNMSPQNASRITENPQESQADDDLIDIAENPYPSIKSFYFPPNPHEKEGPTACPRKQTRVTKDMEALLRIDGELGPLQHKLTEITSKFRALNMVVPSLLSQRHYSSRCAQSSDVSGYYLHRAETFDRGSNINDVVYVLGQQVPTFVDRSSRESRGVNHVDTFPFHSLKNESVPLNHDPFPVKEAVSKDTNIGHRCSSKCVGRSVSNVTNNWLIGENDSCVTLKNSFVHFGGYVGNNPSGSLIPAVSSSCYKCCKNRPFDPRVPNTSLYFDQLEAIRSRNSFTKNSAMTPSPDQPGLNRNIEFLGRLNDYKNGANSQYSGGSKFVRTNKESQLPRSDGYVGIPTYYDKDFYQKAAEKIPESYASTSTSPDVRVISVNTQLRTTVKKHYSGRIVAGGNSYFKEANTVHQRSMNDPELFKNDKDNPHSPRDQSISTSLTVIGSDGSNKTHYMNYTRVGSQTSLIISKKCQSVGTSSPEQTENSLTRSSTHLVTEDKGSESEKERKVQDLDIQCSGFDLNYRRNENLRRSIESLLKPSESDESTTSKVTSSKMRNIRAPKTDEKVIIVPILFMDGIPEPSKIPLFNFTKSKHQLRKTSHHVVKLEKGASTLTQSSTLSRTSAESCTMESYLSQKLMNREHWHSGMSVSCISHGKTPSRLSNTIHTLSESSRRAGKTRRPGSTVSGSTHTKKAHSEPTKRGTKRVIQGMRSSPEDFLSDT